ncbi:sigma-70 family RNA polymerase sigma factor [Legionella israelensis]|uniref:Sigma factor RpoE (Sigma 24) n=1 Tax=Legionella israelensis TaxID=454 RepID=A0A0W0V3M0_9GAMM|nr:sigma-70 family RNA polymerase sigma factor [Legionella israelensis]KTD14721.1 Sigma factor RpoE (sigma 24) [Legionella israelensis]QBR84077.1 sigma-70 family RNA polymerase sigma factor [Legionella israelensis]QBS10964.1 sigma-70 family RNA polymerase sigma factor [Legionella israelensis]QDP72821.1 sigma-70 family RNA polymerase sigma factor [Legionella israelensis]SCY30521.1 RNA polymerase, sigma-24 subunit, RpoE [Legionella israelensis DSM 19235]
MVSSAECSDEQLADLAVNGNQNAYGILLSRYYKKIRLLINLYIREQATANDLTQDVFFKVYRCLHGFKQQSQFSTWVYRITLNTIKNHYRAIKLRAQCEFHYAHQNKTDNQSPENNAMGVELGQQIEQAFLKLPEKLQCCYGLHAIEGISYEEISNRMKCPVGTVRSRIYRARQLLKASI